MTKQYVTKEEIEKIIAVLKKFEKENFKFTKWCEMRMEQRQISRNFLLQTFFEFDKIKLIEEDILKYGDIGYDLHYELSNNRTLIIGVSPGNNLTIIHAILRYRKWQSALKIEKH